MGQSRYSDEDGLMSNIGSRLLSLWEGAKLHIAKGIQWVNDKGFPKAEEWSESIDNPFFSKVAGIAGNGAAMFGKAALSAGGLLMGLAEKGGELVSENIGKPISDMLSGPDRTETASNNEDASRSTTEEVDYSYTRTSSLDLNQNDITAQNLPDNSPARPQRTV